MADTSLVNQRIQEFHERHGGECYRFGTYLIYADGAFRDVNPLGILHDGPVDDRERLKMILKYHERKKEVIEDQFHEKKKEREMKARHPLDSPTDEEIKELKKLRRRVFRQRKPLKEARKPFEPPEKTPQQEAQDAEISKRESEINQTLERIKI